MTTCRCEGPGGGQQSGRSTHGRGRGAGTVRPSQDRELAAHVMRLGLSPDLQLILETSSKEDTSTSLKFIEWYWQFHTFRHSSASKETS